MSRFIVELNDPTHIGVARGRTHGEKKTVQNVARVRSADERLTSHARVCRALSIAVDSLQFSSVAPRRAASARVTVASAVVTHTTSSRPLGSVRDYATPTATPAATLAAVPDGDDVCDSNADCCRETMYETIPELTRMERTTREWSAGWMCSHRTQALEARARNTAYEKRAATSFAPPPPRPFFSVLPSPRPLTVLCCTFDLQNRMF